MNSRQQLYQGKQLFGYRYSFLIFFLNILAGFGIEYAGGGRGITAPPFPFNAIIVVELLLFLPLAYYLYRHRKLVQWLTSIPAANASIALYAMLLLIGGTIPAEPYPSSSFIHRAGLDHLFHSWPYFLSSLQLIIVLGLTVVKRIFPFTFRNLGFFLNHFGLWMVIVSASLGAGDMQKAVCYLYENRPVSMGVDQRMNPVQLPFSLMLKKFSIEEYHPEIILIDRQKATAYIPWKHPFVAGEEKDSVREFRGHRFVQLQYYPYALYKDSLYVACDTFGAVAAVCLLIDGHRKEWISSGNALHPPRMCVLDSNYFVALTVPKAKKYTSVITCFGKNKSYDFLLQVNKPVTIRGWTLYQSGYDEQKGKWSDLSIIELIRDPWLPVVYAGIIMLLAGAVMLILLTPRSRDKNVSSRVQGQCDEQLNQS